MAHGKLVFDGPPVALTAAVAQQIYGDDQESDQVFAVAEPPNRDQPSNQNKELIPAAQRA
jgi:hypothetical protein